MQNLILEEMDFFEAIQLTKVNCSLGRSVSLITQLHFRKVATAVEDSLNFIWSIGGAMKVKLTCWIFKKSVSNQRNALRLVESGDVRNSNKGVR